MKVALRAGSVSDLPALLQSLFMEPFDETSVLIPSATLEDFPVGGSDADARSLLAGWTVLWHPRLLSQTKQTPTWYRSDAPPTPDGPRAVVVPEPSMGNLPSDFRRRCDANPSCLWVTGANRAEMLSQFGLSPDDPAYAPLQCSGRSVCVEDFFAAGYLSLQIQIMTRRLRYTSNLDELHLQGRIVAAANGFLERDAGAAAEGLHDVFDCLSEERDHYFSSDPHLIDFNLLTPKVLDDALDSPWLNEIDGRLAEDDESNGILRVPSNVLVDGDVAEHVRIKSDRDERYKSFRDLLKSGKVGWAGGGPVGGNRGNGCASHASSGANANGTNNDASQERSDSSESAIGMSLDTMSMSQAVDSFSHGTSVAEQAMGIRPTVYARLSGLTPADLIPTLASLGYRGVIPLDFTGGTGFGEESKVLLSSGASEIEALTAKPIDASSDLAFLSIGARLGEAIDTGEIATALLTHWPGQECDSYRDLCRAATWSIALGKFWSIEKYFSEGERPYHSGASEALSKQSANSFVDQIASGSVSRALSSVAGKFRESIARESYGNAIAISSIAAPTLVDEPGQLAQQEPAESEVGHPESLQSVSTKTLSTKTMATQAIAVALGLSPDAVSVQADEPGNAIGQIVAMNPHGVGVRRQSVLSSGAPSDESYIYASTKTGEGDCALTFDVPAMGFTQVVGARPVRGPGLLKSLWGGSKGIAEDAVLKNQFMAVSISEESGGVSGIYSASRGNRLSMRLVAVCDGTSENEPGKMVCQKVVVKQSDPSVGQIQTVGEIQNNDGEKLATYELSYRLMRGSRKLDIQGVIEPVGDRQANSKPGFWKNYLAIRTAVASEAPTYRVLVRDKVHRCVSKRFVAPMGVLIDEGERQTLLTGHGLPLHRIVGDRFVDTPIASPNDSGQVSFDFSCVLDSPHPVAVARACMIPPVALAVETLAVDAKASAIKTNQAWLVHVSAKEVLVTDFQTVRRKDGKLATRFKAVQTRPKTSQVRLQFCTFAEAAFVADHRGVDRPLEELPEDVRCNDGVVEFSLSGHQVIDMVAVFDV